MHYGKLDPVTNSLKFPLSRPCHAGEECFLSYGSFSSSHLLTFYGFLPRRDNPYDVIPLGKSAIFSMYTCKLQKGSIAVNGYLFMVLT